jgi:shikimate dehydrogenase
MTRRVGLIGYPVEHSLSPAFQQAAFDALGLDMRYELWPTPAAGVPERIAGLRASEMLGANVTVPHKQLAFDLVDSASALAREAGAVNTIVKQGDVLHGENTDVAGFLFPLRSRDLDPAQMRVVVLGAGGAARAVLVALRLAGCRSITVANRTVERAEDLARELGGPLVPAALDAGLMPWLREADLLVNATSIGWRGEDLPLDAALLDLLPPGALVYDLTYRATPLLRVAASRGCRTLDGLEMLVAQGAESFRLWTGQEAPFQVMLDAARAAAAAR